jgi:hypothetical protein
MDPTHWTTHLHFISPNPFNHITGIEFVRFVGYNWNLSPGVLPYAGQIHQQICPRISRGFLIAPYQDSSHRLPQLPQLLAPE